MKEAINYLKNLGLKCDINGNILSKITDGEDGIALIDMVEENTENEKDGYCYTIINSKLEKIDI
ncbi:hypothetical protein UFOVP129_63 [uncultured Caudovirales phage]|uniref:Uncharacterized protein n=1 Tax=uncultured Caudovirales phage TaxID=2100421 RepID=A0A6J5LDN1_9CAUD|nr:hypothetical protein UFOVP129_63 [uncultured Caudovirales phage]